MAKITFNIPDAQFDRAKTGLMKLYPNERVMPDPAWVNPADGSKPPNVQQFTDDQWLKEVIRQFIVNSIARGEQIAANEAARAGLDEADSLVS